MTGTVISSTAFNALTADLATGLSTCILKDGTQTLTANIPMSSFKLTGLAAGSASGDSVRYEQVFLTANFTCTGTGFTVNPTGTATYRVTGSIVTVQYPLLSGTSNATTFTITGAPNAIKPTTGKPAYTVGVQDNGGATVTGRADVGTDGVITLYLAMATTAFTNSGTKSTTGFTITYNLD